MERGGRVAIFTRSGEGYGTGHLRRMTTLKEVLIKKGLDIVFYTDPSKLPAEDVEHFTVGVLDARDDLIPVAAATLGDYWIVIDNQGADRRRADFAWDTIPHFSMDDVEVQGSLSRMLLGPDILSLVSKREETPYHKIYLVAEGFEPTSFSDGGKINPDNILYHKPDKKIEERGHYLEMLHQAEAVVTYYGITMFEALFLKKKVYLYPIGSYHQKLSEWFAGWYNRWISDKPPIEVTAVFDGQGMERLAEKITELSKRG